MYTTTNVFPRIRQAFWRHRWLFLLCVVTVTGVMAIGLALRRPTYRAMAATQVVSDNESIVSALGDQPRFTYLNASQKQVNHFQDLLTDDRPDGFLDMALKSAQLTHPINVDPSANDKRLAQLHKGLVLTPDSDNLFTVALTWDDPEECQRIVQALQDRYIEELGLDRQASSVKAIKFFDNQISQYAEKMRLAEEELIDYKQKNFGQLPEAQTADIQQLTSLKTERDNLLISSQDAEQRHEALQYRIKQITPTTVFEQTLVDGPAAQALKQVQQERATLLAQGLQPDSDRVVGLDARMDNLKHEVEQERKSAATTSGKNVVQTRLQNNPEYQSLVQQATEAEIERNRQVSRLANLNATIKEYEARIQKIPEAQRELTDKTRDYSVYKTLYDDLRRQREQMQIKANLDKLSASSNLLPVGTIFAQPTTPRSKQAILFAGGIILGLLVGVAAVILSEWNDSTVRYGEDVERLLELPLLAELPELPALSGAGDVVPIRRSRV